MKIEKLYYFESAARQKSFTKAASECLVAQPAISHSIKSLESELGFDVFVRDKKNVSLTPQGEVFYNDVVKILDKYDKAVEKARDFSNYINKKIIIGLYGFSAAIPMVPILKEFKQNFPEIELTFKRCHNTSCFESIYAGECDLIISYCCPDEFAYDDILFKALSEDKLVLAVPPESNLADKESISARYLANADRNIHVLDTYENYIKNFVTIPYEKLKTETDIELLHFSGFLNRDIIFTTQSEMDFFHKSDYMIKEFKNIDSKAIHGVFYKKNNLNPLVHEFINLL